MTLRTVLGRYPHTLPLISGEVSDPAVPLAFEEVSPVTRAFAPMVREGRYDVCEMAIATVLLAKAWGKDLVLLPVVLAARFQERALLCRTDSSISGPADLAGRRVGVRAYSQTTGLWLRGALKERYGVAPEQVRWVTFEDAHVAEYHDPDWVERAQPGQTLLGMLHDGALDAVIVGNEVPNDPMVRTVFPDPAAAGEAFRAAHGFIPVNHLVTVRGEVLRREPGLAAALVDLFRRAAEQAGGLRDGRVIGRAGLAPAVRLAVRYSLEQGLLPKPLSLEEVWSGLPAEVP
jgi:4,5-dihydroxyphthalate decarboxylase